MVIALTIGWLGFIVLQRILSGRWWLWLLVDMVPPPVFAVVPVLLLVLIAFTKCARKPWLAGGAALSLILGVGYAGLNYPALWGGNGTPTPPDAIRVLDWNPNYWYKFDSGPDEFYGFLKSRNADVYTLSEYMYREKDGERRRLRIDDMDRLRAEFPGYEIAVRGELVTLSRYPIIQTTVLGPGRDVVDDPNAEFWPIFRAIKVMRTDLRVGGRVLSVYNVHLPIHVELVSPTDNRFWDYPKSADPNRKEHLRALEEDVRGNPNPVVVVGDFNISPAMADLDGLSSLLDDAVDKSTDFYPVTWKFGTALFSWRMPFWRVDYAFTSDSVRVHTYELLPAPTMSDHAAQDISISLPKDEK